MNIYISIYIQDIYGYIKKLFWEYFALKYFTYIQKSLTKLDS